MTQDHSNVVRIKVHKEYSEVLAEFSSFFTATVLNEESLICTERLIKLNPSFYPAWKYRRSIIYSLGCDARLEADLHLVREWCIQFPKNFQVWYHRQSIVTNCIEAGILQDIRQEILSIRKSFESDAKNYHAWNWLIWLVRHYSSQLVHLMDGELAFSAELIVQDPYNNSAWNYRFFLLLDLGMLRSEAVEEELLYCQKWILQHPENEAPWNYFGAIVRRFGVEDFAAFSLPVSPLSPLMTLEEKARIFANADSECKLWKFVLSKV